jgi:cytochrome oxidase Cu insertion factor (SCO1/SenC/PrrC family)
MRRRRLVLCIAAGLAVSIASGSLVTGCGSGDGQEAAIVPTEGPYRGSEPPGRIPMPEFELRDVIAGQELNPDELLGSVALITFIDTDCEDQCPLIASAMAEAMRLLPGDVRQQTIALAISVNPLVDTARSVRRFLRERRAEALKYLVGSVAEMKPVWKRFGVVSAYETGDADTHSADVRVFDRDGIWVSTQHSAVDLTPANLAHDITQAIKG